MKIQRLPALTGWLFSVLHWPSPETTEWFCQRAALWWVIQLAPALHLFAVSPSFSGLAAYGTEGHWQALLAALLATQTLAVLLGNLWMRVGTLFAFSGIWAFIGGMFWASSPHFRLSPVPGLTHTAEIARNTGIGVYASLAADCLVVAIHLVYRWYVDYLAEQQRCHPNPGRRRKARA